MTIEEIEATGVAESLTESRAAGKSPGKGPAGGGTAAAYKSVVKKWWDPFVEYAGWNPAEAIQWLDDNNEPKCGTFRHWANYLWSNKVNESTWKQCFGWAYTELNIQLALKLLPGKPKGWIGT